VLEVLHCVGDEDVRPHNAGLFQGFVQEATRGADERATRQVFLVSRLLSDQHQAGMRAALAGHYLGGELVKRAAGAVGFLGPKLRKRGLRGLSNASRTG
jgi:hypothetical protein